MSLRHAILTALIEKPSSGLALTRRFDRSIGYFWQATHQEGLPAVPPSRRSPSPTNRPRRAGTVPGRDRSMRRTSHDSTLVHVSPSGRAFMT